MQLELFAKHMSLEPTIKTDERIPWKLRDLALSDLVPPRVRHVVAKQPANHPLLQLELTEAVLRWPEVEAYLLSCRNMGMGSCRQLRVALNLVVSGEQGQKGDARIASRFESFKTFGEFLRSYCVPLGVRYLAKSGRISEEVMGLAPRQAIERWDEIAGCISRSIRIEESTLEQVRQSLGQLIDAEKIESEARLIEYICSPDSRLTDSVKAAFRSLDVSSPLRSLSIAEGKIYLPILRYRLLIHQAVGQLRIENFEQEIEQLSDSEVCGTDEETSKKLLCSALADHPLASHAGLLVLELFGGEEAKAEFIEKSGDFTVLDLVRNGWLFSDTTKPWFSDLIATFLFESKGWFGDSSGTAKPVLSDQGLTHLRSWCRQAEPKLNSEWVCLHLLMRSVGEPGSRRILSRFSGRPEQRELVRKMLAGRTIHRESTRKKVTECSLLCELLGHVVDSSVGVSEAELSSNELFELLLSGTSDRHREIVLSRFAQDSGPLLTLEEVGESYNVTRERIRQITQKWLQGIKGDGRAGIAAKHVEKEGVKWISQLKAITKESSKDLTLDELANVFPKQWRLILAACDETPKQWLERNSHLVDGRIVLIHGNDSRIAEAEQFLRSFLSSNPKLPILASRISQAPAHLHETIFSTTYVQAGRVSAFPTPAGVVLAEDSSANARRLAFALSVFAENPEWLLTDQQLWNAIWKLSGYRSPRGQWRIFTDSLLSQPRRFRKISRIGWMDLLDCEHSEERLSGRGPLLTPAVEMGSREEAMGDENQRGKLYSLVAECGGLYAKECIELWAKHDESGTGTSAGFLLSDPFFVICHPGITACLDDKGELVNVRKIRERLTSLEALQTYIQFRQGGFGPLDFPAWDSQMLEIWRDLACTNIKESVAEAIIEQLQLDLLAVSEIREKNSALREEAARIGYLNSPRRPADSMLPSLEDVFLLSAVATKFGFINHYLVNCCTGRHWYSHRSISWLALLVAAGLIEGMDHWQKKHAVTERGREVFAKLVGLAMDFDELTWASVPFGEEILEHTGESWRKNIEGTWVVPSEFSRLLVALMDPVRRNGKVLLNPEVFNLSSSRITLPTKNDRRRLEFVDPFLDELLN